MSTDYDLVCHKHKEKVAICSVGISGPMTQCDWSLAGFSITHRSCDLNLVDEHDDSVDEYSEWDKANWKDKVHYDFG